MLALQLAAYVTALWLACYLLARRPPSRPLIFTGQGLLAYAAALGLELVRESPTGRDGLSDPSLEAAHSALLVVPALCWTAALALLLQRGIPLRRARDVALLTTLFFGLGCGLLLFRVPLIPRQLLIVAIGADLLVFGWVVATLDAFDAGERLRPDFARSVATALLMAALFGGQVALAMAIGSAPPGALLWLLLGVLAAAIAVPAFWSHLQQFLDSAVFGRHSPVGERRAALQSIADSLPRQPAETNPLLLTEEEFAATTRRALSSLGDLPKLASSPLARLPVVDRRLAQRGAAADFLDRASELRLVLAESVARLKPPGDASFGTTDAWRHYNALYFPYVAGLKPYGRRSAAEPPPDPALTAAAEWFRTSVPERTLHNWQRAAARLVARDLREHAALAELAADGSTLSGGGTG